MSYVPKLTLLIPKSQTHTLFLKHFRQMFHYQCQICLLIGRLSNGADQTVQRFRFALLVLLDDLRIIGNCVGAQLLDPSSVRDLVPVVTIGDLY